MKKVIFEKNIYPNFIWELLNLKMLGIAAKKLTKEGAIVGSYMNVFIDDILKSTNQKHLILLNKLLNELPIDYLIAFRLEKEKHILDTFNHKIINP
jgi:hypothetical protein